MCVTNVLSKSANVLSKREKWKSLMTLMTLTLMTGFLDRNEMTALLMIFTQRWAVDLFMDEPAYYKR